LQWLGVAIAFLGLFLAFAEGFFSGQRTWASTTVLIRATR